MSDKKSRRILNKQKKQISELFLLAGKSSEVTESITSESSTSTQEVSVDMDVRYSRKQLNAARQAKGPGPQLCLELSRLGGTYLSHNEFRDLVQYSVVGPVVTKPGWCYFRPWKAVSQTVVIRVNCPKEYVENAEHSYGFLDEFFEKKWIRTAEEIGDREMFWNKVLHVPVSIPEQIREKVLKMAALEDPSAQSDALKKELLLTSTDMVNTGFPFPHSTVVPSKDLYAPVTAHSPLFALDCEMCLTEGGQSSLTRISLIREDGSVVLDTLVKPATPITDYLTKFSGITEDLMRHVKITLEDVQKAIRAILPPDAILVGHSLEFDLRAMNMSHPYILDIGRSFNISGVLKSRTSLKNLMHIFMDEIIQDGRGHCSVEDSWAAMRLASLKLQKGLVFGNSAFGWNYDAFIKEWKATHLGKDKEKFAHYGPIPTPVTSQIQSAKEEEELAPDAKKLKIGVINRPPTLCGCGERIGMDCIVENCQCQLSPPTSCLLCLTKIVPPEYPEAIIDWSKAVRIDHSTKVRPLNYYLCDSKKTVMCGFGELKDSEVPESKFFTRRLPSMFKDQSDYVDEVCMDMLDYGLSLVELDFHQSEKSEEGECGADGEVSGRIDEQLERLIRAAAKYSLLIVIMSSPQSSICFLKVKQ